MNLIFNSVLSKLIAKPLDFKINRSSVVYFSNLAKSESNAAVASSGIYYQFSTDFPENSKTNVLRYFTLNPDFINEKEEDSLVEEIQPVMKRMRYEFDHWDNAIEGFRETERLNWNELNSAILEKMKSLAFLGSSCMPYVHVLDLDDKGHIKPHIDSVRFCGDIIAGLNLLTDAVMRIQKNNSYYCDILLKRRSMYIMSGPVRYEFTHEVLSNEKSIFKGQKVFKKRRISLILRSEPKDEKNDV